MEVQRHPHKNKGEEEKINLHLKDVARGSFLSFLGRILGIALSLGFTVLVARLSGARVLGYFSMVFTFYLIGVRISSLGLHTSVLKFGGEAYSRGDLGRLKGFLLMSLKVTLVVSAILGGLTFLFARDVGNFFSKPLFTPHVKLFGIFFPVLSVFYLLTESLKALKRAELTAIFQGAGLYLLASISYLVFYFMGCKFVSPTLSLFLSASVLLGGLILIYRGFFSGIRAEELAFSGFFRVSLLLMASGVFYFLMIQMDRLMLGYFRPAREVGVYSAASRTALLVGFGLTMVNYILPPIISSLFSEGRIREMEAVVRRTARWSLVFSAVVGGLFLLYPDAVLSVFGRDFAGGRPALMILTSAQIMSAGLGSVGYILSMTEYQGFYFRITMLSVAINFVGNLLLIPRWGIIGAALSTGFSLVFSKVWELVYIREKMGFWAWALTPGRGILSFLAVLGISLLLLRINRLLAFPVFLLLSLLYLFLNLDSQDRKVFLSLFR